MFKLVIIIVLVILFFWWLTPKDEECPTCIDGECQCGKKKDNTDKEDDYKGCGPSCNCKD